MARGGGEWPTFGPCPLLQRKTGRLGPLRRGTAQPACPSSAEAMRRQKARWEAGSCSRASIVVARGVSPLGACLGLGRSSRALTLQPSRREPFRGSPRANRASTVRPNCRCCPRPPHWPANDTVSRAQADAHEAGTSDRGAGGRRLGWAWPAVRGPLRTDLWHPLLRLVAYRNEGEPLKSQTLAASK